MQIKHRAFQKGGAGSIKVVPEDDEDIWHLYNLIMQGDEVRASTSRKVQVRAALMQAIQCAACPPPLQRMQSDHQQLPEPVSHCANAAFIARTPRPPIAAMQQCAIAPACL